jgi:nonsense-mediated mRNA decay protein 3
MFCPQCGKTDEKLFNGLCKSCFIDEISLASVPETIEVTICAHCGSNLQGRRWIDSSQSPEDTISSYITEHLKADENAENLKISINILNIAGSTFECLLKVNAVVLGEPVQRDYPVKVIFNRKVCPDCSKFASGYYEAVIQIRADKRLPSPEEIKRSDETIKENIERISKKNRMAYISERLTLKEGVDYYIGSFKVAKKLTSSLKNILGGIVKESPRLMGRDKNTGKDLYRIWISLRLPQFQKGDFVSYNQQKAQVSDFNGNKIYLRNLESSHKSSVSWRDYEKIKVIAKKEDVKSAMVTAKTPKSIQILHPDTYQPLDMDVGQELLDFKIGEEVKVVEIEGTLYILKT